MRGKGWGTPLYGQAGVIQNNMVLPYGVPIKPSDMQPLENDSEQPLKDIAKIVPHKPGNKLLESMGFLGLETLISGQSSLVFSKASAKNLSVSASNSTKPIFEFCTDSTESCCLGAPSVGKLKLICSSLQPGAFGLHACLTVTKPSAFNCCGCCSSPEALVHLVERGKKDLVGVIGQASSFKGRSVGSNEEYSFLSKMKKEKNFVR